MTLETQSQDPRNAAHCIEYAKLVMWEKAWGEEEFDADVEEHVQWVCDRAKQRADTFGI